MEPIDNEQLASVTGGFLGALLGAAGPILNGVAGIIGAAKSGGGGAAPPAGGAAQGLTPPMGGPPPTQSGGDDPLVSVSVISGAAR